MPVEKSYAADMIKNMVTDLERTDRKMEMEMESDDE